VARRTDVLINISGLLVDEAVLERIFHGNAAALLEGLGR